MTRFVQDPRAVTPRGLECPSLQIFVVTRQRTEEHTLTWHLWQNERTWARKASLAPWLPCTQCILNTCGGRGVGMINISDYCCESQLVLKSRPSTLKNVTACNITGLNERSDQAAGKRGKKQRREKIQGEKIAECTRRSSERWTMNVCTFLRTWNIFLVGRSNRHPSGERLNPLSFPTDTEIKGRVP